MREDVWKYVAIILALMLAASTVSAVLLYMHANTIQLGPQTGWGGSTEPSPSNCSISKYEIQLRELRQRVDFLKAQLRAQSAPEGNGTIAIIPIFGIIDSYTALSIIPTLREVAKNDSTSGVLLWIESPGGEVGPVIEIYNEVSKLNMIKPVVAYTGGLAASGGYYIAAGAEKIIAAPLAEVGSIGVLYVHYDMEENYEMNGVKVEVFKTGPHKDMGAEWRALTPEEKEKISNMIEAYFNAFLTAVEMGRNMTPNETQKFATGETWFAENVVGSLVDETGDLDYAISVLENLTNTTNPKVVIFRGGHPSAFKVYGSTALFIDPRYVNPYIRG
ncbi:MAG: signal peptide peptidase SppA [Thermococcus sp.]|nr:signal peptide peptidase SppA [Thermococcus sp.]